MISDLYNMVVRKPKGAFFILTVSNERLKKIPIYGKIMLKKIGGMKNGL